MTFTYKVWDAFCRDLDQQGKYSVPVREVLGRTAQVPYLVLKHDVETNVARALHIAQIEHKHGHRGTYYVQAYLLDGVENRSMLRQMQDMGHEISYHYDVMDSCKGNIALAMDEFASNVKLFEENGFHIETLCQHGNPVVERVGYTSNRDFFRADAVQAQYPALADVMVDLKIKANTDYLYFSDAGRRFKRIYDPINNDVVNSDDKNIPCDTLAAVMAQVGEGDNAIISIHPHRWCASQLGYAVKTTAFKAIRFTAKLVLTIPFMKKLMGRFYYLAKKI